MTDQPQSGPPMLANDPMAENDNAAAANNVAPTYRGPIIFGLAVAASFFVAFGAWAALAPIESAVIAPGVVKVEGQRKTVQHLEGGIVSEILVREGEPVAEGQILFRLDDTQPSASLKLLRGRYLAARVLEARLIARRDDQTKITFADDLKSGDPSEIGPMMAGQIRIFQARTKSLESEKSILQQRIGQLGDEIVGLEGQIKSGERQLELIADELSGLTILYEKGLAKRDRILALQRTAAAIDGDQSKHMADVARAEQRITETRLQIDGLSTDMMSSVVQELNDTQKEIYDLGQRLVALEDVLTRTDIRAPISGTVVALQVHSARGVITPGARLLDIVPNGGRLVVEVQIQPVDIDIVRVDLPAEIRFTAFDTASSTPVEGVVRSVSADRLTDERSGVDYFLARVETTGSIGDALGGATLSPGMQAEVMINAGDRTPLDYLISPVTKSLKRAMREE